jgi:transposase
LISKSDEPHVAVFVTNGTVDDEAELLFTKAVALIEGLPDRIVMADTAYDADHLRAAVADKGALAVIPNNPSRASKHALDNHPYARRHLVECCFSRLK